MLRRLFRLVFYLVVTAMFVAVAVVGFTQTRYFRTYLRNLILERYPEIIDATLYFEKFEGNFVTGMQIHNIVLSKNKEEVFSAERIEVKYDPTGFLFNKILLKRVTVINPWIHVWRSADGTLNLSHLIRPFPKDTARSSTVVEINEIGLTGAKIAFDDSVALRDRSLGLVNGPPEDAVDYARIRLDSVQISASARVEPKSISGEIKSLSFESRSPRLEVSRFEARFTLTPSLASVQGLTLETKRSSIKLDVQLKNIDLASLEELKDLEQAPVQMGMNIQKLDSRELRQFLYPYVDFLDRSFALQAQIRGPFGRLSVEKLSVRTPKSVVQAQGTVSNLHKPDQLRLDFAFLKNKIDPEDIRELLPGLALPDVRTLGNVSFDLTFQGPPTDFAVNLGAESDAGSLQLDGSLKITNTLTYKAKLEIKGLDLGVATGKDEYRSSLNARAAIDGSGTDLRSMKAVGRVDVDSSLISDLSLTRSEFVFDIGEGVLNSRFVASLALADYNLSGEMHFLSDSTAYRYKGSVSSLNLSSILKDPSYQSDLSFTFSGSGSWDDKQRMRTAAVLAFTGSSFNNEKFDSGEARVSFDGRDATSSQLVLKSDIADLSIRGTFNPGSFVSNVSSGVDILSKAIAFRIRNLDSLRTLLPFQLRTQPGFQVAIKSKPDPVSAMFSGQVHSLHALGVVVHEPLRGTCALEGTVDGDMDSLKISGELTSTGFVYGVLPSAYSFGNVRVKLNLAGISRVNTFESFNGTVDGEFAHGAIGKIGLSDAHAKIRSSGSEGSYEASVLVDSTTQVEIHGTAVHRGGLYQLNVDQLKLSFGATAYENVDPISLLLGQDGFQFKSFSLRRETEELTASGYFNPAGVSDLDISMKGFLLNNLQQMIPRLRQTTSLQGIGGIVSGRFLARGDLEHPNYSVDLVVDGFRSKETVFGKLETRLSYFEHLLNVYASYRFDATDPGAMPDMSLSGTLPYELSLTASHNHSLKGEIDLKLQSRGMRLDLLSPFLPVITHVSGFLSCDMKMKGSVDAPEYDGYLALSSARFTFVPLGIDYFLDGRFVSNKTNILFEQVTLKNVQEDQSYGKGLMNLTGNFNLEGLKLGQFDLNANGQILLMKETSRPAGSKFYGDLFVATGTSGIRWKGELSKSYVSGEVLVRNGKITLPPERETILMTNRNISIAHVDDTSKTAQTGSSVGPESLRELLAMNASAKAVESSLPDAKPEKTSVGSQTQEEEQTSFLDKIEYNLVIEMQGPTQMRLVFNPITNEELFADLRGRLVFEKNGPEARLNGQVEVTNRSYYNYFKRFEATGKLSFTGNALNPELNIVGKYEDIHKAATTRLEGVDTTDQKVLVLLEITGTREEPKLKFGLQVQKLGKYEQWKLGDEESNAITFLLSGQFRDELTASQKSSLVSENFLVSVTSGVLSAPLREYLRKETGVSLDVLYYGGPSFQQSADVRVSGEIGEAVVRFGGRVLNNINNTNFSVELPMSSIVGIEAWRNLILTVERHVEGLENLLENRASNGARLLYRINF